MIIESEQDEQSSAASEMVPEAATALKCSRIYKALWLRRSKQLLNLVGLVNYVIEYMI